MCIPSNPGTYKADDEPPQEPTDDGEAEEIAAEEAYRELAATEPVTEDSVKDTEEFTPSPKRYSAPDGTPGGQRADDADKIRFDLIPPWPFYQLGQVYTIGAKKYGDDNWKKGMSWMRMVGSMKRHLEAFIMGESYDQADGQHHLASVAWGAFALQDYELFRPEFDDRPVNVLAIARALYEKAQTTMPAPPPSNNTVSPMDLEALTDAEKDTIDKARALLVDKSEAAAEYLTEGLEPGPGDKIVTPEPPTDPLADELAARPQLMEQMSEQADLTEDEKELLRRAKEVADNESPEVQQNRAERRRAAREERKAEKKTPAPRTSRAPGIDVDHEGQSLGTTRFADVNADRRRGA